MNTKHNRANQLHPQSTTVTIGLEIYSSTIYDEGLRD